MGHFSWLFSDTGEQMIMCKKKDCYLLVPPEFQKKYGKYRHSEFYDGYGSIGGNIYELMAEWNKSFIPEAIKLIEKGAKGRLYSKEKDISLLRRYYAGEEMDSQERQEVGIILAGEDEYSQQVPYPVKITTKPMEYAEVNYSKKDEYQGVFHDPWDDVEELYDYDPDFEIDLDCDDLDERYVFVKGVRYPYESTWDPAVPDDKCCSVLIDGTYYYFS